LTAAKLKLDPALALTDPAVLVRSVPLPAAKKIFPVSFMPHHRSMLQADWPALCGQTSMHCIDPRKPVQEVLLEIAQTELLLAEAMHGAIVADALRVPWIPVRMYSHFLEFKWQDWAQSLEVPLSLASVPPICTERMAWRQRLVHAVKRALGQAAIGKENWNRLPLRASTNHEISKSLQLLEGLPKQKAPHLSDDKVLHRMETRLREKLSELRGSWKSHAMAWSATTVTRLG